MWNASRRLWRELAIELFDRDGLDTVFSHARDVLTAAAIIAAALGAARHLEGQLSLDLRTLHLAGYGVAALGACCWC